MQTAALLETPFRRGKLLAVIGALYGWQAVLVSLFVGSLLGAVISLGLLALKRGRSRALKADAGAERLGRVAVPFGPFLATAAVVFVFIESELRIMLAPLW